MSLMNFLFSYGTLQNPVVQRETFGRILVGRADTLLGYRMGEIDISDMDVVRKSGLSKHPVAIATGDVRDEIPGTVFEITDEELLACDTYEVEEYERVWTALKSGQGCWVYVLRQELSFCRDNLLKAHI